MAAIALTVAVVSCGAGHASRGGGVQQAALVTLWHSGGLCQFKAWARRHHWWGR